MKRFARLLTERLLLRQTLRYRQRRVPDSLANQDIAPTLIFRVSP